MVKICILTTVHPPFDTRIFHKEAKTLFSAGYDVTLIAQHEREEILDGIKIVPLPTPRNRLTRILFLTWRAFRLAYHQHADIYHFHDPEVIPVGVLLKLLNRGKVIYDVHEDVPEDILNKHWIPSIFRRPISGLFDRWEKSAARFLDEVIVATEEIAKKFRGLNPTVVHNYPNLQILPDLASGFRKGGEINLVYVGVISKIRGAFEMIQALEYLNPSWNSHLIIIGRFDQSGLENKLKELQGYTSVRYLGTLPWAEAWKQAQNAMAGLVLFHPAPNHTKSLPNKLFEYMAAGLPVIASDFPLWKEIVEGNQCGLIVDPRNPKEIAEAIEYLILNPEEAQRMGENGRRAVIEKYNWELEGERLLTLYEALLEE